MIGEMIEYASAEHGLARANQDRTEPLTNDDKERCRREHRAPVDVATSITDFVDGARRTAQDEELEII